MKRFSETEKWKDKWFRSRTPQGKLLFLYLVDNCNNAGFIEIDFDYWNFQIGLNDIRKALDDISEKLSIAGDWIWITNFLKHQKNLPLNPENNAHKQIITLLRSKLNLFSSEITPLLAPNEPLNRGIGKGKGKVEVLGNGNGNGTVDAHVSEPATVGDWSMMQDRWKPSLEMTQNLLDAIRDRYGYSQPDMAAFNSILIEKHYQSIPDEHLEILCSYLKEFDWKDLEKARYVPAFSPAAAFRQNFDKLMSKASSEYEAPLSPELQEMVRKARGW